MSDKLNKDASPEGVLNDARQMVSQLQEQAKNGQIDGSMLDQLQAMLDVTVDAATDAQTQGKDALADATKVEDPATSEPSASKPSSAIPTSVPDETTETTGGDATTPPEEEEEETTMETTQKADQPLSNKPPRVNLLFDKVDDLQAHIPDFIQAMTSGRLKKAQEIAGHDNAAFDTMFNMAQRALLNEGGWTQDNMEKLSGMAQLGGSGLAKSITAASVPGIYLIKLAKLMLPLYAGLVNRIPADSPKEMSSDRATWKAQLGYGTLNFANFFRVAEAAIGVEPPTNFLTYIAPFNDMAVTDSVTMKALAASRGYSDPMQISVIKSMSSLLSAQEKVILGSSAGSIAAPGAVTVTAGSVGAIGVSGSYIVQVTALTYEGWLAGAVGGSAAYGESTATSAASKVLSASENSLLVTFAAVEGAVAYNIYLAASGSIAASAQYNKTVVVNKALLIAASGSAAAVAPTSNLTANAYGIEGLLSWCLRSTIYSNASPSKVAVRDLAGAGLTAGNGGIVEFDVQLASLWTNWKIAPSLFIMSPNMNATLVGKLQSLGAGTFYRVDVTTERNKVQGGMMVTGYVNKFAPFADGTPRMVDIIPHPDMPDGTIAMISETIPYPMGNESRGFVRDVLLPYTYFPLPSQTAGVNKIQYVYSITTSEVLECFNPSPQTAIVGVDYTL